MATLEFLGATREVTGSCYLLHTESGRILLECGLIQGSDTDEARNYDAFPFSVNDIDAVVISHAHIDHSGRLPLLYKRGYRGKVFAHEATVDLCGVMLEDSGYIHEKEAEWENKRRRKKQQKPVEPLYKREDARETRTLFEPLEYENSTEILPGVTLCLHDAGHILGSAIVDIEIAGDGQTRRLVFSGDLGHKGAPILRDPQKVPSADLVVMESTYGDRLHRSWAETWNELGEIISSARAQKGNLLIPAFSVGRTQELLYLFHKNFENWGIGNWRIFLDSPMAIRATRIYRRNADVYDRSARAMRHQDGSLFDLENLHLSETTEQSMGINQITSGAIIIAGSGMCTGGRIRHHLRNNISRRQSHVIIVGFQAAGTTGRALVDGAQHIRLMGKEYSVRSHIHTVGGLSAHADRDGLLEWYMGFENRPRVALVHGEPRAMDVLQNQLGQNQGVEVFRPQFRSTINI